MFSKLIMATTLAMFISGCAPLKRLSYITPTASNYEPAIDVSLVNSQVTLAITQEELGITNKQLISKLIQSNGNSYKQRVLIQAPALVLRKHRSALIEAVLNAGINASQLRVLETKDIHQNQAILTTEFFVATAPSCQQQVNTVLGCATARNKALSVSSPVQLIRGKTLAPADAARQIKAIDIYQNPPRASKKQPRVSKVGQ